MKHGRSMIAGGWLSDILGTEQKESDDGTGNAHVDGETASSEDGKSDGSGDPPTDV